MREENAGPIRVLVVDDHDLFRTGLASVLSAQSDFDVVAQASSGAAGVRLAHELRPDVVLMDLRMPGLPGEAATRAILERDPEVRILVLTVATDDAQVVAALRAGACGYLVKDAPIDDIVDAARAAAEGRAWLSAPAAGALIDRIRAEPAEPALDRAALERLTPREIGVLRLLARGAENAEIAAELGISSRTAKNHVSAILAKLELRNRVQAAVFAVLNGLD